MENRIQLQSKEITNKDDIAEIANMTADDFSKSFIMDLFGTFGNEKRFNTYDLITIPAGCICTYKGDKNEKIFNKQPFKTTVGKYVFNKYFVEPHPTISKTLKGWVNEDMGKKPFGKVYAKLTNALLEGSVNLDEYKLFIMKSQQVMPYVSVLFPAFYTPALMTVEGEIQKKKEELIKENQEAVDKGDIFTVDKISNQLLDYAKEELGNDQCMDYFNSGVGSWGNNFKNIYVMRGAVKDPDPTKGYNVITSSFSQGIKAEEYSKFANTLAAGPYARAVKTQYGGYWEKLFMYAYGHVTVGPDGSDCGTKRYIEVDVNDKNIKTLMYSYAIENGKLVEITSDNKDSFIGRRIKIRFSSMCEMKDCICNVCAGNFFKRLGFKNIGMLTAQIPDKLKLISMKAFHDDQIELTTLGKDIDPMHVFSLD